MKALERMEQILDEKDQRISELEEELESIVVCGDQYAELEPRR